MSDLKSLKEIERIEKTMDLQKQLKFITADLDMAAHI